MKKLLSLLAVCLALTGYSQTNPPVFDSWITSPIVDLFTHSNFLCGTYAMYDTTDKSWGGGVFAGYKLNEFIVPIMRIDDVKSSIYAVSGNIQLQLPLHLFVRDAYPNGILTITPFAFTGVATSWNNQSTANNGNVIGIFGTGGAISFGNADSAWYVPKFLAVDYERWTGSGFNDNQIRAGLGWKF